jgi:hypothetical protein
MNDIVDLAAVVDSDAKHGISISGNGLVLAVGVITRNLPAGGECVVYDRPTITSDWAVREVVVITGPLPIDNGGDYAGISFGTNPSLSYDGMRLVVGAERYPSSNTDREGMVLTYNWTGSTYIESISFVLRSPREPVDDFSRFTSWGMGISGDGLRLAVNDQYTGPAPFESEVALYSWSANAWVYTSSVHHWPTELDIGYNSVDLLYNGSALCCDIGWEHKYVYTNGVGGPIAIEMPERIFSVAFMDQTGAKILASANGNIYVLTYADSIWTITEPYADYIANELGGSLATFDKKQSVDAADDGFTLAISSFNDGYGVRTAGVLVDPGPDPANCYWVEEHGAKETCAS